MNKYLSGLCYPTLYPTRGKVRIAWWRVFLRIAPLLSKGFKLEKNKRRIFCPFVALVVTFPRLFSQGAAEFISF